MPDLFAIARPAEFAAVHLAVSTERLLETHLLFRKRVRFFFVFVERLISPHVWHVWNIQACYSFARPHGGRDMEACLGGGGESGLKMVHPKC